MNEKIVDEMSLNDVSNSEETKSSHKHTVVPKWYSRLAAWLTDNLILMLILFPIIFLTSLLFGLAIGEETGLIIATFVNILISFVAATLYFTILQSKDGQTWGMKLVGIKLSLLDGGKLNFQTAFLRNLFVLVLPGILSLIPILGGIFSGIFYLILGISVLTNKNGQGLHDKMFGVVFSKLNEKTTRSKVVIGCYCGCLSVTIVFLIIGFVFFGMAAILGGENLKNLGIDQNLQKMIPNEINQEEMPRENQTENKINDSYMEEVREDEEISEEQSLNNNSQGNEFYKACMEANTNESLDLSDYCACAEKEFMNGGNLNSIVTACKDQIKIK